MADLNRRFLMYATAAGAVMASASAAVAQTAAMAPSAAAALPPATSRPGKTVTVNGTSIFYGEAGQGSPMLLVHGYPLSGALFGRVVDQLAQNHRVITPDLRGFGQSGAGGMISSADVYVADMLMLMDKLGIKKATIAGMSMGGAVVLGMYKKAPERFNGIVLIDTTFKQANSAEKGLWNGGVLMAQNGQTMQLLQLLLPQMLTGTTRMNDKGQVTYLTSIINQASPAGLESGGRVLATRPDATAVLPTITVPALVVVGEDDPLYGFEVAQMMQAQIKGAQLHIVPGAAHAAIFEKPEDAGMAIASWAAANVKMAAG